MTIATLKKERMAMKLKREMIYPVLCVHCPGEGDGGINIEIIEELLWHSG